MTSGSSLRERQAAVIREAILDALASRLDSDDPVDVAMPQVAADAGISLLPAPGAPGGVHRGRRAAWPRSEGR